MAKQGPLRYDRELYSAATSQLVFSEREARQEYARLRRLANRRLAALERAGYGEAAALKNYPADFGSLRGASEREVRKALAEVSRFMSLKTTTIRGIQSSQKKAVSTMQEHGYDFINKNNIESFGRFMAAAKKHAGSKKAFDSEQAVAAFHAALEEDIDPEDLEDWLDEWEDKEDYEPPEPDESERVKPARQQPTKAPKQLPKKRQPARKKREQRPSERWKERAAKKTGRRGRRR